MSLDPDRSGEYYNPIIWSPSNQRSEILHIIVSEIEKKVLCKYLVLSRSVMSQSH